MTMRTDISNRRPELDQISSVSWQGVRETNVGFYTTRLRVSLLFFGLVGPLHQLPCHVLENEIIYLFHAGNAQKFAHACLLYVL